MRRTLSLAGLLMAAAVPAIAHPGQGGEGFLHPLTGVDHLLAMLGVGLWAALLAGRRKLSAVVVPASFVLMMAVGAAAGFAGIKLPLAEAAILASVFAIGALVMAGARLPAAWAAAVVGLFALFHGYAHALEAPASDAGDYILGFLVATALLQGLGLGLGWVARRRLGDLGLRALGGVVLAGGALVLITN